MAYSVHPKKRNVKTNEIKAEYINAAYELLCNMEYESISIRQIAKATGRNSASIYYYFNDFEELMTCASIRYLIEYYETVSDIESKYYNDLEVNLYSWGCFAWYAFGNVPVYENFFLRDIEASEKALDMYLEVFPEEKEVINSYFLGDTFLSLDLKMRDQWILKRAAGNGMIKEEDIRTLSDLTFYLFFGIMNEIRFSYREEKIVHEAVDRFIVLLTELYRNSLQPGKSLRDCHLEQVWNFS